MGSDMDNLKLLGIEHHGVIGSLRQVGQQFGMAGISVPGEMQRLFIQRRGSDGRDRALQRQRGRPPDAAKREIPCLCVCVCVCVCLTSPGRSPCGSLSGSSMTLMVAGV